MFSALALLAIVNGFRFGTRNAIKTRLLLPSRFSMATSSGAIPPRSTRKATVAKLDPVNFTPSVKIKPSSHELTFVESLDKIDEGPLSGKQTVDAWTLSNGKISAKVVLQGGNLVSLTKEGSGEYVWLNKEGATNYGAQSDAFPLTRGLILHGGIRLAAVSAEHGLYYDTDWDISFLQSPDSSSIVLSITDTEENRKALNDPLSKGQYLAPGSDVAFSKYPVTNAKFTFKVTLKKDEEFLRLESSVQTDANKDADMEVWLPQTYPLTKDSQIISHQKKRRVKDSWVNDALIKGKFVASDYKEGLGWVVDYPSTATSDYDLNKVLSWPSNAGGILYDYPRLDGPDTLSNVGYHGISFGDGRGAVYATHSSDEDPHYTKLWGWGDPALFDRRYALTLNPPLAAGRPKSEYYEPWGSAYNTAFFETYLFEKASTYKWDAIILPIDQGLQPSKSQEQLRETVDGRLQALLKSKEPIFSRPEKSPSK